MYSPRGTLWEGSGGAAVPPYRVIAIQSFYRGSAAEALLLRGCSVLLGTAGVMPGERSRGSPSTDGTVQEGFSASAAQLSFCCY